MISGRLNEARAGSAAPVKVASKAAEFYTLASDRVESPVAGK
jgi:hypothetical protein